MNILENLITDPDNNVQTSEAHSIKLEDIEEVETPKTEMDKLIEDEIAYSEIDHKRRFTIVKTINQMMAVLVAIIYTSPYFVGFLRIPYLLYIGFFYVTYKVHFIA